ncbi:MAG TPA: Uma2 family endonuclease [Pyrinomonadaceae bacterium]|nr:Uma2 family endonuclease [Pyrinomonadaceae bacterium]
MTATLTPTKQKADGLVLHFGPIMKKLTDDEFFEFCQLNKDLRIELTSEGDLIIMPPTGGKTGRRNVKLTIRLGSWAEAEGSGQPFDSSTGFTLPNGAKRSPDFAWVSNERWDALTDEKQEKFPPLCPDFVVELRSSNDSLTSLQQKMEEYVSNGAQLGWLIDPFERKVHVYQPGGEVEILDDPESVSGEPVLRGFALDVRALWE